MISRDIIETIRERVDIVEVVSQTVTLKRRGSSLVGLCPFHQEKTPSFNVVPAKGIFHCFGCGEGGDVFKFVQKTRGLEFYEVVKELAATCGVEIEERELTPQERARVQARLGLHEVCEKACQFYQNVLLTRPEGAAARDYLRGRGFSAETIERYRLGFAPAAWDGLLNALHRQGVSADQAVEAGLARRRERGGGAYDLFRGRVIIPIEDGRGRVVAFGGRVLPGLDTASARGDAPKYVNSPETDIYKKSHVLYGLSHARGAVQRTGRLLVVEGYFDVLALHQAGVREAVATCGTALTDTHVRIIRPLSQTIYAVFDTDEAGLRAAVRSLSEFVAVEIEPFQLDLSPAKDPDEFLVQFGAEALTQRFESARELAELLLERMVEKHGSSSGAIDRVVDEFAPVLRSLSRIRRDRLAERLAAYYGLSDLAVKDRIGRGRHRDEPSAPQPARWTGNIELNHLFWLLIHHPDPVIPVIADTDPSVVTDRPAARLAIGLLMAGQTLAAVIAEAADADLERVLVAAAAKQGLYTAKQAGAAAQQIVDRMRMNRIRAALLSLDRELSTCTPDGDRSRYFSLLERRQTLQREKDALQRQTGQPPG